MAPCAAYKVKGGGIELSNLGVAEVIIYQVLHGV